MAYQCDTCPFTTDDPLARNGHENRRGWLGQGETHTMSGDALDCLKCYWLAAGIGASGIQHAPTCPRCSRDDDPTQHDRRADLAPSPSMNTQHAPTLGAACRCYECRIARIPVSPFVRHAMARTLPAKALAL